MFPFVVEMNQKTKKENFKIVTFLYSNSLNTFALKTPNLGKN